MLKFSSAKSQKLFSAKRCLSTTWKTDQNELVTCATNKRLQNSYILSGKDANDPTIPYNHDNEEDLWAMA